MTKLSTVYLSGQAMFTELGRALRFDGQHGWHMVVSGGYVSLEILEPDVKAGKSTDSRSRSQSPNAPRPREKPKLGNRSSEITAPDKNA